MIGVVIIEIDTAPVTRAVSSDRANPDPDLFTGNMPVPRNICRGTGGSPGPSLRPVRVLDILAIALRVASEETP